MSTNTNTNHIKTMTRCKYCKDHTHFIDPETYPNDAYARELEPGKMACGNCIDTMEENIVLRTSDPTSPRYKQVIAKRQAELDKKTQLNKQLQSIEKLRAEQQKIAESNKSKYQRLTG
jgi:hypothetical protein